jgi:succinate dehydrogenase/fumarate reductase flavoprotein subunit
MIDRRPGLRLGTDVLVVGGGAAGVAAAVTAARQGRRVTLV